MSDLISRQAALEVINGIDSYFAKYIDAIPAADVVERKTGKWLWLDGVRCSNCNHKFQTTGLTSYCPNCGSYNGGENEV